MKVLISMALLIMSMTLFSIQTNAQNSSVAIGDATPKSNAVLYLKSPGGNQGLIIPVVGGTGSFGEAGMIVYNSGDQKVYFHNGSAWAALGGGGASAGSYTLSISGNSLLLKDGATTVSTVLIAATAPTAANQFLTWDGTKWVATTFSQDATNANGAITVNGIKGKAVPALPSSTQALVYNGTAWIFQALSGAGTVTSVATGTGLTGGPITSSGTIGVDVGTTAGKIVQLDGTGKLPAVDGSQLINLPTGAGDITAVTAGTGLTGGATTGAATLNVDVGTAANKIVQLDGTGRLPAVNGSLLTSLPDPSATNEIQNLSLTGTGSATTGESFPLNISSGTGVSIQEGSNVQITQASNVLTINSVAGGSGTVTNVSVINANGFNGSVSNATTTPAITLSTSVTGIIKGNGSAMSTAVGGTDYLAPNGSAAALTGFPTLNQNTTGTASSITGNITQSQVTNLTTDLATKLIGNTTITPGTNTKITYDAKGLITAGAALTASDLPVMTATVGGAVPSPPNNTTSFLRGDGTFATPAGGGTVTSVSGTLPISVATQTTTPVISISQASATTNGYLGFADWSTFNGKGSGTVTSIGLTMPSIFTVASSPVTSSGTIGVTYSGTALPVANGGTGRTTWDGLLLGSGSNISDISTGTSGQVLTVVGTSPSWANPASGGWGLTGNTGTTFGTNFLGTSDDVSLSLKTNNLQRMFINNDGRIMININNTNIPSLHANAILDIVPNGAGIGNMVLRGSFATPNDPVDIEFRTWDGATALGKIFMNPNASDMLFEANGVTRLALQNDGDVGIGTTNPGQKLDVVGNVNLSSASTYMIGASTVLSNTGTGNIFVGTNSGLLNTAISGTFLGTAAGRDNTTGTDNTFIGRNSGLVNANGALNVMVGSGSGQASTGSGNTFVGYRAGFVNTSGIRNTIIGREADVASANLTNAIAIGYQAIAGASNTFALGGTGSNAVNVGIGTSTPHAQLQLASTVANRKIVLYENTNDDHGFLGFGVSGTGDLRYQTAVNTNDHVFFVGASSTSSTELMRIKGNGLVGIGTAAPTSKLSVNGTADKVGGGTWGTFSDRRVKKDIHSFNDGLDVLMKFKPVQFKYNGLAGYSDDGKEYVGVIAQDVLPVAPYMISTVRTKLNASDMHETDVLKYDASALTYVLVNSIKEQQTQIEELKKIIQMLEAKLSAYEHNENSELAAIREQIKKLSEAVGMEANAEKKK